MKLRTVILARHDGKYVLCVDKDAELGPDEVAGEKEVIHDAAAAHALMHALSECARNRQWILNRASELMREWGLDNWEDA